MEVLWSSGQVADCRSQGTRYESIIIRRIIDIPEMVIGLDLRDRSEVRREEVLPLICWYPLSASFIPHQYWNVDPLC